MMVKILLYDVPLSNSWDNFINTIGTGTMELSLKDVVLALLSEDM